jgi:hypothetical protein
MNVLQKITDIKINLMKNRGSDPTVAYLGRIEIEYIKEHLNYFTEKVGSTDEDMLLGLKLICVDRETYLAVH